jgi:hypothetical protein
VARLGLKLAREYGFTEARQIQLYLEMMVSFGSGFDSDPQYSWLHPYLEKMSGVSTRERSRLLCWHATVYLDRVYGEDAAHGIAALERASLVDRQTLEEVGQNLDTFGPRLLARLHPRRMEYLDMDAVNDLLQKARSDAQQFGLMSTTGAPLLFLLMFGFGHLATDDALYPWIRRTLTNAQLEGQERVEQLLQHARTFTTMMLRQIKKARS